MLAKRQYFINISPTITEEFGNKQRDTRILNIKIHLSLLKLLVHYLVCMTMTFLLTCLSQVKMYNRKQITVPLFDII